MNKLLVFLNELNCFDTGHSGRSLGDHLMNTFYILEKIGASKDICLAGGLHSIYGTNVFTKHTLSYADRDLVSQTFGPRAEYLAYLFSRINRPYCLESGDIKDAHTGESLSISRQDLEDLRIIEAANLFEQGADMAQYPNIAIEIDSYMYFSSEKQKETI
jgi:hypothetical protein